MAVALHCTSLRPQRAIRDDGADSAVPVSVPRRREGCSLMRVRFDGMTTRDFMRQGSGILSARDAGVSSVEVTVLYDVVTRPGLSRSGVAEVSTYRSAQKVGATSVRRGSVNRLVLSAYELEDLSSP